MLNKIARHFDIYANVRPRGATARSEVEGAKQLSAWPQWIALLLGIAVQPYLTEFRTKGLWNFEMSQFWGWLLFAALAAIIIFPSVYRNTFDPQKPIFLQLIPIFTAGLGWEALFGAATQVAGG
jgi:hypothetical protein